VAGIEISLEEAYAGSTRNIELATPQPGADQSRTLRVNIPAGVTSGQRIRLGGQGSPGMGGGPAGDLYLEITFASHPLFTAEGRDVLLALPIAPWEAALGATVQAPTLGGAVDMRIPHGARAGQRLRLKGRGLPGKPAGDQFVVLKIVVPPADTPRAKELYEQMQRELDFDPRAELTDT
jgi:curved DNA-binding protein